MTIEEAVNRQADHENLVRELTTALSHVLAHIDVGKLPATVFRECYVVLEKVVQS